MKHHEKVCPNCGAHINQSAKFCERCGLALRTEHSFVDSTSTNNGEQTHLTRDETSQAKRPAENVIPRSGLKRALLDRSTLALLVSNVLVVAFAIYEQWNLVPLLWIYWAQSVIIGVFTVFKIRDLTRFSMTGFTINNVQVPPTLKSKRFSVYFFVLHYGIFTVMYFGFLAAWTMPRLSTAIASAFFILTSVALFFANHLYSYLHNREQERQVKRNIPSMMALPYLRIIPIQLSLFLFVPLADQDALILFLALKTIVDVCMHAIEHAQSLPIPSTH